MQELESVEVYSFRVFHIDGNEMRVARHKATRKAIVSRLGGEVLEGTGQTVPQSEVDEAGRYRRIATGWGELG